MTMEHAIWALVWLVALALVFQLYQWIEVNSAKRDMMRAYADATRSMQVREYRLKHGGHTNPPPEIVGATKPPPPPPPPAKKRRRR